MPNKDSNKAHEQDFQTKPHHDQHALLPKPKYKISIKKKTPLKFCFFLSFTFLYN